MLAPIRIAVDAMGGDNSPEKVIRGISLHSKKKDEILYNIFGDVDKISEFIKKYPIKQNYKLFDTKEKISNEDTALSAAKKGKNTSMWKAIDSVRCKESDIVVSAGNTGALFVIAKLNIPMIENIDKPALSALWPNKIGMNVVLDLGANVECNEKNLKKFKEKLDPRLYNGAILLGLNSPVIKIQQLKIHIKNFQTKKILYMIFVAI